MSDFLGFTGGGSIDPWLEQLKRQQQEREAMEAAGESGDVLEPPPGHNPIPCESCGGAVDNTGTMCNACAQSLLDPAKLDEAAKNVIIPDNSGVCPDCNKPYSDVPLHRERIHGVTRQVQKAAQQYEQPVREDWRENSPHVKKNQPQEQDVDDENTIECGHCQGTGRLPKELEYKYPERPTDQQRKQMAQAKYDREQQDVQAQIEALKREYGV